MTGILDDRQRATLRRKLEARYAVLLDEIRTGLLASDNENDRQLAGPLRAGRQGEGRVPLAGLIHVMESCPLSP